MATGAGGVPLTTFNAFVASVNKQLDRISRKMGGSSFPSGAVMAFATATIPTGWLECDGGSFLRTDYPALFSSIGTAFGAVDSTHFSVPNLRGRVAVGRLTSNTSFATTGQTGGAQTRSLSVANLPSHTHTGTFIGGTEVTWQSSVRAAGGLSSLASGTGTSTTTGATGSGTAFDNMPPYLVLRYAIHT